MTKSRNPFLFTCWLMLALAFLPALRAQEKPATPPPAEQPATAPSAVAEPLAPEIEKPAETAPADDKTTVTEPEKADGELRDLAPADDKPSAKKKSTRRTRSSGTHGSGDQPPHFGDQTVAPEKTQSDAVTLFGNTQVDGHVTDAAVSIFGNTTVNGRVNDAAVSVFGTTTINGKVGGKALAIFGNLVLGPDADVGGEAVAVFGRIMRAPGAQIHGRSQEVGGFNPFGDFSGVRAWIHKCLFMGRPLWIGEGLGWVWIVAACFLAFYLLLAVLFPKGIEKSVDVLEQKPGATLLASLLTMLLTPVLFVLLIITGVGIVLIPFLAIGGFFAALFGKAAALAWMGRRVTGLFGTDGTTPHVVAAVFVGGLIAWAFYLIPFIGFLVYKGLGVLGLGMVIYRLILSTKRDKPAVAMTPSTGAGFAAAGMPPLAAGEVGVAGFAPLQVPPISAATLPRAGFWHRLAASAIDAVLVGIVCGFLGSIWHGFGDAYLFWFAAYCVILWATKGTTIGGIICGLKVVRLDDRRIDWGMAAVRALGGFLSLFVAGLGFIWVSFDDEKQSWHDKIAGTTIVRVPKGTPLL